MQLRHQMSTLTKVEIEQYLNKRDEDRLVVSPILDKEIQLGQIGIDLRLSNQFITFRIENINAIDRDLLGNKEKLKSIQTEIIVPFGTPFYLHPGSMVLGATFEYICLPQSLEASIEGRSSWARLGLIIATAVTIEPGFKGCITLELANISEVPITLYPGIRIGQLICRNTCSSTFYINKKYIIPIGPEFSRIHQDKDSEIVFGIS